MTLNTTKNTEELKLLVSFLDEENNDVLGSIYNELLKIDKKSNEFLSHMSTEFDTPIIYTKLKEIIALNNFRYFEEDILEAIENDEKSLFELLCIVAKVEYPNINLQSLKYHFDSIVKDIWLGLTADMSALDVANHIKYSLFNKLNIKHIPNNKVHIKHLTINDVLVEKKTINVFLNLFYLCITEALNIPVVALKIFGILVLAFENTGQYAIGFFDATYLFFIDNSTLNPYPEMHLREKFNISDSIKIETVCANYSKSALVNMLIRWFSVVYDGNGDLNKAQKLKELSEKLKKYNV